MPKSPAGLTVVETVLIIATLAVIGFVGFAIYQASQGAVEIDDPLINQQEPPEDPTDDIPDDPDVEEPADLEEAIEDIEDIDIEAEDISSQLEEYDQVVD